MIIDIENVRTEKEMKGLKKQLIGGENRYNLIKKK